MYDAEPDPYCYAGSTVLKNRFDLRDQAALDAFEAEMTAHRSDEPFPAGRFSVSHYKAVHHHLFQDVYPWAGKFRTVRLAKSGSAFCYPENIRREMEVLFADLRGQGCLHGLAQREFAVSAASFLSTLNAIHPFREGNGRAQLSFLALLADQAGHPLNLDRLRPVTFLEAMVRSFQGDDGPLVGSLEELVGAH